MLLAALPPPALAPPPFVVWFPSHLRKCLNENGFSSLRGATSGVLLEAGVSDGDVDCGSAAGADEPFSGPSGAVDEDAGAAFTEDEGVAAVRSSVLMLLLSFAIASGMRSSWANCGLFGPPIGTREKKAQ